MYENDERIGEALAAVRWRTDDRGWMVMRVSDEGTVYFEGNVDYRTAKRILKYSASLVTSTILDRKRKKYVRAFNDPEVQVKKQRPSIRADVRFRILKRDGHRCAYCGATAAEAKLHVDHRIPVSKGGPDTDDNLVTACQSCNLGKGARL